MKSHTETRGRRCRWREDVGVCGSIGTVALPLLEAYEEVFFAEMEMGKRNGQER